MYSNWEIDDPDYLLSMELSKVMELEKVSFGDRSIIYPREDMIQATNKNTNYILDLGYYGCEDRLDGIYRVRYIKDFFNWDDATINKKYKQLVPAICKFIELLKKL